MKTRLLSIACLCLISTSLFAQTTVWIADNNFNAPTGDHIFSSIQEAVNAASAGDSIYIQPSPTTYGSATIEKELHLFGIGFDLDKENPAQSEMLDIILRNNVDNTSNASNSTITGLIMRDFYFIRYTAGGPSFTLEGVAIYNNQFRLIQDACCNSYLAVDSVLVYENYVTNGIDFVSAANDVLIRNNLIVGSLNFSSANPNSGVVSNNLIYGSIYKNSQGDNVIIQNNNFISASAAASAFSSELLDAIVVNNIFYGRTPSISTGGSTSNSFQRNTFTKNLSYSTGDDTLPPTGGGDGNNGSPNYENSTPVFVNVPLLNNWSSTYDFTLDVASEAVDGGTDDTDVGITGGPYPWTSTNFSLRTTSFPTIQSFNVNTIINPGDDLDATINVKAN